MSWFTSILGLKRDDPATSWSGNLWPMLNEAGIYVDQATALQLSAVWACVDAITKALASSPWCIFGVDGERRTPLRDDPMHYLLNTRANPESTAISVREALLYQCLTNGGNGYAEIVRDGAGRVTQLWPLESSRMYVTRNPDTRQLVYQWTEQNGNRISLDPYQVFHLRGPSVNGLMGDNLVARASRVLGIAAAADRFAGAFFGNGATVGTIIEMQKVLDQKTHDRLKASWAEWRQGAANAHKPIILEAGSKVSDIGAKPQETQLLDTRKFSVLEICRYFGVPPHIVGDLERATFSNIESQQIDWVTRGLTPWARRLEQEANFKLFPQRVPWRETVLDLQWLMRGDQKSRWESYQIARRIGVYSANDILEKEGENTIGGEGDLRIVEKNMVLLDEDSLRVPEPAAAAIPGENTEEPEEDDSTEGDAVGIAQSAATIILAGALDRYVRRLSNKRRDLESQRDATVEGVAKAMEAEQVAAFSLLASDAESALSVLALAGVVRVLDVEGAAQQAVAGVPAAIAAAAVVQTPSAPSPRMEAA